MAQLVVQLDTLPNRSAPGFTLADVVVELIAHLQLFLVAPIALLQQVCECVSFGHVQC
jgi:hypothetical protein